MTSRADVMNAVIDQVRGMVFQTPINGVNSWRTVSNRLRLWADVPSDQQPAAFVVTHREMDEYRGYGLVRRRLELGVWCYTRSDSTPGGPDLDALMESFEQRFGQAAVDNNSTNQFTLGGLVEWCRIEGSVFKDPGDIDNQTLLIVPIVVEVP